MRRDCSRGIGIIINADRAGVGGLNMRWKPRRNVYEWHRVFALRPRLLLSGEKAWLEYVERKGRIERVPFGGDQAFDPATVEITVYDYRVAGDQKLK